MNTKEKEYKTEFNVDEKSMKDYENNCYKFILNLVKELAQDYDVQYQHMDCLLYTSDAADE